MADEPTLDSMVQGAQDTQFAQVESRLIGDYGAERRNTVHTMVEQERRRFAGARVHAFVPILVERSVSSRLATAAR
jgi:hypothetical protein